MAAGDELLLDSDVTDNLLLDSDLGDVLLLEEDGAGPTFEPAWAMATKRSNVIGAG